MSKRLKYTHYDIVFQEVPNETTLVFNVSGCLHKCEGCHSKYLWEYQGRYISDDISQIILQYNDLITCVCFMGGDQNLTELKKLLSLVKSTFQLKTCIYSGSDNLQLFNELLDDIDYLKIGRYIKEYGGLGSIETNQRFYKVNHIDNSLIDITTLFIKKEKLYE